MHLSDAKQLETFQTLNPDERILVQLTDESRFSQKLTVFSNELKKIAPRIKIKKDTVGMDEHAGLKIAGNLNCHFIPSGPKLNGFLSALSFMGSPQKSMDGNLVSLLGNMKLPADIRLFIAEGCPHCPHVVAQLIQLPFISSQIHLDIFDSAFFSDIARKEGVQAVPTTLLDPDFRWTGDIELAELAQVLSTRDPRMLSAKSLQMLLQDGNAQGLVQLFQKSGSLNPNFIELLIHPSWSTRLGAMVVMETLIESTPNLAAQMHGPIWTNFYSVGDTVKGDLLYILGEMGLGEDIMRLKTIVDGADSMEVKEAANEALAKMSGI